MASLQTILKTKNVGEDFDQEVAEELFGYFESLSPSHKSRVLGTNFQEILEEMVEFQPLQNVQKEKIENAVVMVLLGLSQPIDLTTAVKHEAEIARERAEKIVKGIESVIFPMFANEISDVFEDAEEDADNKHVANIDVRPNKHVVPNSNPVPTPKRDTRFSPPPPVPQKPVEPSTPDSLDIFKKRLESPVHTSTKEETVSSDDSVPAVQSVKRGEANTSPSSPEHIAKDPYKETID